MKTPAYYRLLMVIVKPIYRLKLAFSKTLPQETYERFGKAYPPIVTQKPMIWCHAVSLGEINTAYPLLRQLLAKHYALWITNTTHTGFARTEQLFANELKSGDVYHSFVPVDTGNIIGNFLDHINPIVALFIETELWATTLSVLKQRNIASVLVNGRLSEKSFGGYQRFGKLSQSMMDNISLIIAQDADSAKYFGQLGASFDKICLAASLKWSSQINPAMLNHAKVLAKNWGLAQRTVIVASSTHAGEESQILATFLALNAKFLAKKLLLIIVPRHPERFDEVAVLIQHSSAKPVIRRSQNQAPSFAENVYLADSMGELGIWYALADIAFIGGSWVNVGGHNPVEAAIVGKPMIMGQYTRSCQLVVDKLKKAKALQQVYTKEQLYQAFEIWLKDSALASQAGQNGQQLAKAFQNATDQQLAMIEQCL
ncbi:3-deoxy-D-manno-octulosonic-acid transferase [Moraxella macacae 0408225]|uniref:3-deoxy-D-manno-octulosonic acid transferase n=1 Tax=Moraxella macacae 0408225 TaxID=1230338 RepID=L2F6F3_9GAMM|nr:3-deoxy-D-manno-octulosonic acid transferase [Moraxella macacae]ELA08023.1 3-deoxy-D-manno-octulosonic-acid transferase [Moraxella macacae 0408225]